MLATSLVFPSDDGHILQCCSTAGSPIFALLTTKMILKTFEVSHELKLLSAKFLSGLECFSESRLSMELNAAGNFVSFSGKMS
jgi:hypothetical protein